MSRSFATPQDAETAFYEALERANLEQMMTVWADDDGVVCVHPTGIRLVGQEQIRDSWTKIFAGGPSMRVHLTQQVMVSTMTIAIHSVQERFFIEGSRAQPAIATNVYLRDREGWRMVVHHASPSVGETEVPPVTGEPKRLH